jgi:AraC-like DNA-binding protein
MIVKSALTEIGVSYREVSLGLADVIEDLSSEQQDMLKALLLKSGLELMDDKKAMLVERVKTLIIEMIHYADELPAIKKSVYISEKLKYDYTYLANLFSEVTGTTIEQYIISHKIERAKKLILYDEMNLTQIAYKLHYSSVGHLSAQFKKVTGLTPTYFRKLKIKRYNPLEDL